MLLALVSRVGRALEEAVEHDLVAFLVSVGEMQDEGRIRLEPPDVGSVPAGNHREARRHVRVEARQMKVVFEQLRIPEKGKSLRMA